MKSIFKTLLYFLFLGHIICNIQAQELPPIQKFSVTDYGGDNQNWMISQTSNNFIYVANNKGLLEFDGSHWTTYSSPNNTILRAVNAIGNRVYTGCYSEFGYWEKNKLGVLEYTSLVSKLNNNNSLDEETWNIIEYNNLVLFQTSKHLFIYNTDNEKFKTISSKNLIYKLFKVGGNIYYHVANEGVYLIENGKPKLVINNSVVLQDRVINIFKTKDKLLILTRSSGFYQFENDNITKYNIASENSLKAVSIFNAIQLEDKSFMVGTISNGILHLNKNGQIDYTINQKKGLSNNTVLSLYEDKYHNVWAGLDNGINCINVKSPIKTFTDYEGVLGTVYATKVFGGNLYLGTNQGLFYRKLESINDNFKFIEGTAGQVWSLYNYKNENLICGHHLGTFLVDKNKIKQISNHLGGWNFKPIPNHEDLLLQGNYDGLYILKKNKHSWQLKNKIEGFDNSSRYFEINNSNEVWVSHEFKGVFKLKLNDKLNKAIEVEKEANLPLGKNTSLTTYKNNILYASEEGVFKYNKRLKEFRKDLTLSKVALGNQYISGKMVVDFNKKL